MAAEADIDLVADLSEGTDAAQQQSDQQREEAPADVRSLLQKAMKDGSDEQLDNGERPRGPDGKFVEKVKTEEPPAGQEQNTQQPQDQGGQQPQDPNAVAEAIISKLPEGAREEVRGLLTTRDTAFNQYAQKLHDQLNGYDAIEQLISPRRDAWALNGLSPDTAIRQLFALSDFAGRDPAEFIRTFASQHNLDLSNLADDFDGDPALRDVNSRLDRFESQFTQSQTQQQQQVQHQQQVQLEQQIEQFATEKDATGNAVRPYFAEVANDVMMLIPGIRAVNPQATPQQVLSDAYERAVWANPSTRAKVNDAQRIQDARERADNARRAGSSITGGPTGEVPATKIEAKSVRDAIRLSYEEHR